MIAYDLQCANGHTFEGWFKDGPAFEHQKNAGMIACPMCDDTLVTNVPSKFAIKRTASATAARQTPAPSVDIKDITRKIIDYVDQNFDDVGCDFAREALKIHYGAAEPRNIKGVSTFEEEKVLKEEGVTFFKFPKPDTSEQDT